jgi:hypothetical protein
VFLVADESFAQIADAQSEVLSLADVTDWQLHGIQREQGAISPNADFPQSIKDISDRLHLNPFLVAVGSIIFVPIRSISAIAKRRPVGSSYCLIPVLL